MNHMPALEKVAVWPVCLVLLSGCLSADRPTGQPPRRVEPAGSAEVKLPEIYDKLDRRLDSFGVQGSRFGDALNSLAQRAGVNIVVNWGALESLGITPATEVTLSLTDVPVETVLAELLVKAAGREGFVGFIVRDDVVKVSSTNELATIKCVAVYNIRDVLAASLAWQRQRQLRYEGKLPKVLIKAGDKLLPADQQEWTWDLPGARITEQLILALRTFIVPDAWDHHYQGVSAHDGLLVVRTTPGRQREVARFLVMLRAELKEGPPGLLRLPEPVPNREERLAARRLGTSPEGKGGKTDSPLANQRVRELMQRRVPEIRFNAISFENALNFLRDLQRVSINPNWGAMEQLGITKATEITLQLRDVTFETALRELLAKAACREDILGFLVRDGVIKVSTVDDLATLRFIRIYNVRDIIAASDAYHDRRWQEAYRGRLPETVAVTQPDQPPQAGSGLFGNGAPFDDEPLGAYTAEGLDKKLIGRLVELLRLSVDADSWDPTGWGIVMDYDGLLIIKQTAQGHRKVERFLADLRSALTAAEKAEAHR